MSLYFYDTFAMFSIGKIFFLQYSLCIAFIVGKVKKRDLFALYYSITCLESEGRGYDGDESMFYSYLNIDSAYSISEKKIKTERHHEVDNGGQFEGDWFDQ